MLLPRTRIRGCQNPDRSVVATLVAVELDPPLDEAIPDPDAGGTDLRDANEGSFRRGTLLGAYRFAAAGSPYFVRHVDVAREDVVLEPGVVVYALGGEHARADGGAGLGDGGRVVQQAPGGS